MKIGYALGIGCTLCFFLAGSKIYDCVRGFIPPAKPGECIDVQYGGKHAKLLVVINSRTTSVVVSQTTNRTAELSFSDLRDGNAMKVDCK